MPCAANRFRTRPIVWIKAKIVYFAAQRSNFFHVAAQQSAHLARTERHRRRLAQGLPDVSNRERWPLGTTGRTECQTSYAARFLMLTPRNRSRRIAFALGTAGTDGTSGGGNEGRGNPNYRMTNDEGGKTMGKDRRGRVRSGRRIAFRSWNLWVLSTPYFALPARFPPPRKDRWRLNLPPPGQNMSAQGKAQRRPGFGNE